MRCGQQCAVSLLRGWDDVLGWIASQIDKVNFWPISYSHARTHAHTTTLTSTQRTLFLLPSTFVELLATTLGHRSRSNHHGKHDASLVDMLAPEALHR